MFMMSESTRKEMESFPDGTLIEPWFYEVQIPEISDLGKPYVLTDYGIRDDGRVYTEAIQAVIDRAAAEGGGVVVVPPGTFVSGALFFKQGVHLSVQTGATLKGSDDPADYPQVLTRIEGQMREYSAALINAEGLDGFVMLGGGTIDGNGLEIWKACWARWEHVGGITTNTDAQRARLVFLSHCSNVLMANVTLQNSQFWTTHLYKSNHIKILNCRFFSPAEPVAAPSTDAIDIDVCTDVLVKGCHLETNDDTVVLKGGRGPWADTLPENGANERVIIEDCEYGFCHGCLTCGSESIHDRNIILRRVKLAGAARLLWMKMRPDTPQHYEYIHVEQVEGRVKEFLRIYPWDQFYDLQDRPDQPLSYADHVSIRNCSCTCDTFFNVLADTEQYRLSDFVMENLHITARVDGRTGNQVENLVCTGVEVLPSTEPESTWHEVKGFQ